MSEAAKSTYATSSSFVAQSDELPWAPFPGVDGGGFKLLRVNRDIGGMTSLLWIPPGARGPMHKHCGAGEYLILRGHLDFGDRTLGPGDYFFEPAGLVHSEPPPDEDVIMLVVSYGPIATKTPEGTPGPMVDVELLERFWERALERARNGEALEGPKLAATSPAV